MDQRQTIDLYGRRRAVRVAVLLAWTAGIGAEDRVELCSPEPLLARVVLEISRAARGGEIGMTYNSRLVKPVGVEPGRDLPRGAEVHFQSELALGGCPADATVDRGLIIGWLNPVGTAGLIPAGRRELFRISFVATGAGGDSSPLKFARCLGDSAAPIRNMVTGENGRSILLVTGDGQVNLGADSPCAERPVLPVKRTASAQEATLDLCRRSACFRFQVDPVDAGKPVILSLTDAQPGNSNFLHLRWGEPPTPGNFDLAALEPSRGSQRLVIPSSRADPGYVLVTANVLQGDSTTVRLETLLADLALESISPRQGGEGGRASAVILGGGFQTGVTGFALVNNAHTIPAEQVTVVSSGRAEVVFQLPADGRGVYDLRAKGGGDQTVTLPAAFEVLPPDRAHGLELSINGLARYGYDRLSRFTLRYRNVSGEEMAAPLFKITAPAETAMRLERDADFQGNELEVLGINPFGFAGRLPPGAWNTISIVFRSKTCLGNCPLRFQVFLFTGKEEPIAWQALPEPPGVSRWTEARSKLEVTLGKTWGDFHEGLADIATRLARRGTNVASVRELFRFAYRLALERPGGAAVGLVHQSLSPVSGAAVLAYQAAILKSVGTTDERGTFALDWLEQGQQYRLEVVGHAGSQEVQLPPTGDRLAVELTVEDGLGGPAPPCPTCNRDESGLPQGPLVPPPAAFTKVLDWTTRLVAALDPNDKEGPEEDQAVGSEARYSINFENKKGAGAPALRVEIVDPLPPQLRAVSVVPLEVQFGDHLVSFDQSGEDRFNGYFHLPDQESTEMRILYPLQQKWLGEERDILVSISFRQDLETGALRWVLESLDPVTFAPPESQDDGFLLPGMQGQVTFEVGVVDDLGEDTVINNAALIGFDGRFEPPANHSHWVRTGKPYGPNPPDGATGVPVDTPLSWGGLEGSTFDLYLWEDGKDRLQALSVEGLTETSYQPSEVLQHLTLYHWQVVAHVEGKGLLSGDEWQFSTAPFSAGSFRRGEINGDGLVDITDPVSLLGYLFLGGEDLFCLDAGDTDDNGELEITDAIRLLAYLFLGGAALPLPGPDACGGDPTPDKLSCVESSCLSR